jgi:predicted secreted hydrolase
VNKGSILTICVLITVLLIVAVIPNDRTDRAQSPTQAMNVSTLLANNNSNLFEKAEPDHRLIFPRDHGPHDMFRNEWWYITGNLFDESKQRYGFQLTFFRRLLSPSQKDNRWQDNTITMAHFALSDHKTGQFFSAEKLGRSGAGVAGAQLSPFKVWLDDWQISSIATAGDQFFPLKLKAKSAELSLELTLTELKPITLQGVQGYSQKSEDPNNASYYYSFTRLKTEGTLSYQEKNLAIEGYSWLDREWSTSALAKNQQGWDWFALQLNNGDDLMFYQIRHNDGTSSAFSSGIIVTNDHQKIPLTQSHVSLSATQHWTNRYGQRFPVQWQMTINHDLYHADWIIRSPIQDQFLDLSVRYWEGAIDVLDAKNHQPLGLGFLEMTGYP